MSQILIQQQKASQLLRQGAHKYKWIRYRWSDDEDGRCAIGVIMSELGWDGKDHGIDIVQSYFNRYANIIGEKNLGGIGEDQVSIAAYSNDGHSFEETADWMESNGF